MTKCLDCNITIGSFYYELELIHNIIYDWEYESVYSYDVDSCEMKCEYIIKQHQYIKQEHIMVRKEKIVKCTCG